MNLKQSLLYPRWLMRSVAAPLLANTRRFSRGSVMLRRRHYSPAPVRAEILRMVAHQRLQRASWSASHEREVRR
ncbi:MAG TPA: hypothetical protein VJN94_01430 [Candidatus Binataceae bacterium]|nr:hypothetical protein [Candidatus Binataceae bacterium]